MKISKVMTKDVRTISTTTPISQAAVIMRDYDVGALPVVDEDRLVGMLTDRDIVTRCVAGRTDTAACMVQDAMSSDLITCHMDDKIEDAARRMEDRQVRRMLVVDDEGHCVGIVSLADLVKHRGAQALADEVLHEVCASAHSK
jgi:CBS domain-containing protein